jgi:hypothetical protein
MILAGFLVGVVVGIVGTVLVVVAVSLGAIHRAEDEP